MAAADSINIASPRTPIQPGDYMPMQDGEYLTAEERLDSVELYLGKDACTGASVPLNEELDSLQKRITDHDNDLKELKADKCECLQDVHQACVNEICEVKTKTWLHGEKISRIFQHINRLESKMSSDHDETGKMVLLVSQALHASTTANEKLMKRVEALEQEAKRRKLDASEGPVGCMYWPWILRLQRHGSGKHKKSVESCTFLFFAPRVWRVCCC